MKTDRACDRIQVELSARFDGVPPDDEEALDHHLRSCVDCRAFESTARALRQQLRYETIDDLPDTAPDVAARLTAPSTGGRERSPRRRWLAVAAVFVIGVLVGAVLVTDRGTGSRPAAAAAIPEKVAAAQFELIGVDADFTLIEHGWNEQVPERRWRGRLLWTSPETLSLELTDETAYPSKDWVPDDVSLVVDRGRRATTGPRDCPATAQPLCTPTNPRVESTVGREPFADGSPIPLDLVLPVDSFAGAAQPEILGRRDLAGRRAIGLMTTAAQVQPLLDGLRPAGNLRELHPADPVELWLDEETMTPLRLVVRAGDASGRATWAANRGYEDEPGQVVLELSVDRVRYGPTRPDLELVPEGDSSRPAGFVDGPVPKMLTAARVPVGFEPYRTGTLSGDGPDVDVATWTDGRAWIKVRSTPSWPGGRLFGSLGPMVRTADLPSGGVAYVGDGGDRIGVHTPFLDVVVVGSVRESLLLSVAGSLGLAGEAIPADWDEAATADVAEARSVVPGLLLPDGIEGFRVPTFRVEDSAVTINYTGPGDRSFTLVETPGRQLAPPLDLSVTGVVVRGEAARWSDARHELEWVEEDLVISLRSASLSLGELLTIAELLSEP